MTGKMTGKIADTSSQDTYLEPTRNTRLWIMGCIGLLVILAILFSTIPLLLRWLASEDSVSRERLRIATVTRGDFIRDISVQGKVVASVSPTLYTNHGGTITFEVVSGDQVQQGSVLATIDSPQLTNQLQQAQAMQAQLQVSLERNEIETRQKILSNKKSVDLARLQLTATRRELARADLAIATNVISEIDHQKAGDDLESAEYAHQHAVADADLDEEKLVFEARTKQLELDQQILLVADLQRQVNELTLISPVSGIVGNLLVQQKTSVTPNMPVLSVVDLSRFEIEADVPQNYADDMALGMAAEILTGTDSYPAQVVSISPEIIDDQVTTRLRFVGAPPRGLRQNQRLTTRVLLEEKKNVLMVTRGQFLESGSGRFAFRIEDDIAYKQTIQVGARSLNTVELLSGLNEGDNIIISSTELFANADTVLITN